MTVVLRRQRSSSSLPRQKSFLVAFLFVLVSMVFLLNLRHSTTLIRSTEVVYSQQQESSHGLPTKHNFLSNNRPHHQEEEVAIEEPVFESPQTTQPTGNADSVTNNTVPSAGAFIHIGKTAGSTLSLLLRNGCHSFVPKPCRVIPSPEESMASKLIGSYYHGTLTNYRNVLLNFNHYALCISATPTPTL